MRVISTHLLAASLFLAAGAAAADQQSAVGYWVTPEGGSVVQITPCGGALCGAVVGLRLNRKPGDVPLDQHNPDASKRGEPICGLTMMGGLKPAKDSATKWEDGWVYNPDEGSTYAAEMKLDGPDTLKLRGFLGISLFGRTMTWTRETGENKNRCTSPTPKAG